MEKRRNKVSQEERYGNRCNAYSAWHRRNSTRRFVGIENAQLLAMIDIDVAVFVEYDDQTKDPLIICEVARDVGQAYKPATVTANLSKLCTARQVPAYLVLYRLSDIANPADDSCKDIAAFRVKRLWPNPVREFTLLTPQQWAERLLKIRLWVSKRIDETQPF